MKTNMTTTEPVLFRRDFRAMGCEMVAMVESAAPMALHHLLAVPAWFETWEQHLSRFRGDSELSRLNRSTGRAVSVSQVLWEVVQAALAASWASKGLVDPTILGALEAAGYDRSFERISEGQITLQQAGRRHSWRDSVCNRERRTVTLRNGARLDLGGVAKGWAADRAVQLLSAAGPALVDVGGDIAVSGPPAGTAGWPIGVADPTMPDRQITVLVVPRGGVATSGRDYRRWFRDGVPYHHIIDPRTGRPAVTDVLTATVVAPSAVDAEIAAKVVLILGGRAGVDWLEKRPQLAGLVVCDDGRLTQTSRLGQYLWNDGEAG